MLDICFLRIGESSVILVLIAIESKELLLHRGCRSVTFHGRVELEEYQAAGSIIWL